MPTHIYDIFEKKEGARKKLLITLNQPIMDYIKVETQDEMVSELHLVRLRNDEEDLGKLKSLQLMSLTRQAKSDCDCESDDWETAIIDQLLRSKEWNQLVERSTTSSNQQSRLIIDTPRTK